MRHEISLTGQRPGNGNLPLRCCHGVVLIREKERWTSVRKKKYFGSNFRNITSSYFFLAYVSLRRAGLRFNFNILYLYCKHLLLISQWTIYKRQHYKNCIKSIQKFALINIFSWIILYSYPCNLLFLRLVWLIVINMANLFFSFKNSHKSFSILINTLSNKKQHSLLRLSVNIHTKAPLSLSKD